MEKLYVLKGMVVSDFDSFIDKYLTELLKNMNMSREEMKELLETSPYVAVNSLDKLTDKEMQELKFLMATVGGFEDMVGVPDDSTILN